MCLQEDKNPVYVATERMFHDCVVLLLSLGADPSMKDDVSLWQQFGACFWFGMCLFSVCLECICRFMV